MHLIANNLDITNLTPGQVSISLQTMKQTTPRIVIPANLNPILNDINEPDPKPTTISFDNTGVQKISIIRFSPNMPQIIYYDNQNTADAYQKIGGMKSLSLSVRQNRMIIWNDFVEINNVAYSLNDLNSYVIRINFLKDNLSQANLEDTKKLIDDLQSSLNLVNQSDMASALSLQIAVIQALIDATSHALAIMQADVSSQQSSMQPTKESADQSKELDAKTTKINELKKDLSLENLDATQKQLEEIKNSLNTISHEHRAPSNNVQIAQAQAAIDAILNNIKIIKSIQIHIQELQNLQSNLALGDNNLKGTNKPYKPADDSIDRAQLTLNGLKKGFPTLMQAHLDGIVAHQIQALQSAMNGLQNAIDQMQTSRLAVNYEELLPQRTDLQTFQNV